MKKLNLFKKQDYYLKISLISFICLSLIVIAGISCSTILPNRAAAATLEEAKAQLKEAELQYDKALCDKIEAMQRYDECQETIDYASWKVPELQAEIMQIAKETYIQGFGDIVEVLLGSKTLGEFINRMNYLDYIKEKKAATINECKELKEAAEKAEAELQPSLDAANASEAEALAILQEAQGLMSQLQAANINVGPVNPGVDPGGDTPGPTPTPTPTPTPVPVPTPSGDDIVSRALSCLGHPYGWGCAGSEYFDCSGLVSYAYTGVFEHKWCTFTIRDEAGNGLGGWWRTDTPVNGTCCCSNGHCGIYYNGQMIHAPEPGDYVKIGPIQGDMLFYNR